MQWINKPLIKKSFVYTWYIYPIIAVLISVILLWSFEAFHLPKDHEKLSLFIAGEVKNDAFKEEITKHFDENDVREFSYSYILPSNKSYIDKLELYLNDTDFLILPEKTLDEFGNYLDEFFVKITRDVKTTYLKDNYAYYTHEEVIYGVKIKDDNTASWLDEYITFEQGAHYLVLSMSSHNVDTLIREKDKGHDNALKAMKYIIEGENA